MDATQTAVLESTDPRRRGQNVRNPAQKLEKLVHLFTLQQVVQQLLYAHIRRLPHGCPALIEDTWLDLQGIALVHLGKYLAAVRNIPDKGRCRLPQWLIGDGMPAIRRLPHARLDTEFPVPSHLVMAEDQACRCRLTPRFTEELVRERGKQPLLFRRA